MPIVLDIRLDNRNFDKAFVAQQKRASMRTQPKLSLVNIPQHARFAQTGTLRSGVHFSQGYYQFVRAAERNARSYELVAQASRNFQKRMAEVGVLLWRIERPRVMLKWGMVLALMIAGVAIWSG